MTFWLTRFASRSIGALALVLAMCAHAEAQSGTLQFSSPTYSVNENAGFVTIEVTRVGGTDGTISSLFSTADGSAAAPGDYQSQNVTVTFLDGAVGPALITVPLVNDAIEEPDETFTVQLVGGPVGSPSQAILTIVNDDHAGTLQFSSPTYSVSENAGFVTIEVTRVGGIDGTISTLFSTADDSAAAPGDYQSQNITVTFLDGAVGPALIALPIVNDAVPEPDETLTVRMTGGPLGAPNQAIVTIVDDEPPVGVLQFTASAYSGGESSGSIAVTMTRVGGTNGAISATLTTTNGSAAAPGDYAAQNTAVTFADGTAGPVTIAIPLVNDSVEEPDETFSVQLAGGPLGSPSQATVTIVNDDHAGTLQFSSPAYSVDESGGIATVQVTRVGGTDGTISATIAAVDGSATAPGDYQAQSFTVTFADGTAGASTFAIPIVDDSVIEGDETFAMQLSGAPIGTPNRAMVTIVDNDRNAAPVPVPLLSWPQWLALFVILLGSGASRLRRRPLANSPADQEPA